MLKQIRSWLALILLVVTLVGFLAFTLWVFWLVVPWLAYMTGAWLSLLLGMWFYEQFKLFRRVDAVWQPTGQMDRRRTDMLAHELRRLDPNNRTAALILDHKPVYERREDLH